MSAAAQAAQPWTHHEATVNGVRLHYVEAGAGPLVVLLHGFPEFWYSWRHQIPALAGAGFHVIAPDLRGYGESGKPAGVASYRVEQLTADVAGLIRHAGASRAVVAGHDWGGVLAWLMPLHHPGLAERLIVLNAPHPAAYLREVRRPAQFLRSWYALFFQLPWLPEALLRAGHFAALGRVLRHDPVRRDAFTPDDVDRYKHALARPGALTASLNYYRALFRSRLRGEFGDLGTIDVPTLLIWGDKDRALSVRLTHGLEKWVPRLRVERIRNASHWVQNDAPQRVNELMLDFLSG
jgi:pimeloyl-ACP methyl ester carboxylesterase